MKNLLRRSKATKVGLALITLLFLITVFLNLQKGPALKHLERLLWSDRIYPNDNGIEEGKDTFKSAESDNIKRVQHLRRECEHVSGDVGDLDHLQYLIVDEKYKMVFCYIPKISCSQWKTIFITLTGKVNASLLNFGNVHEKYQSKMKFLKGYSAENQKRILTEYKKYIIVRNPLERILSAYRNKLMGKVPFRKTGKEIIKRYRSNATLKSLQNGDDVTFFEFVQYLTDDKTERFDHHWEKYTTLCHPCIVKYDFIGKYETISRDADFILKDIEAPPEIRFPKRSERYSNVETIKTFNTYYSRIPAECIAKLWNIYRMDFELFGYSISDNFKMIPNA
ncbi:carbohydrate sulfotransferase 11-like [Mizuhopecten yessoensis]|uniref:carbohydrate sulfotransferase 11-like n=1 Tax=Mizuhopecten yessoensis TaxID=6573 RepID=UPI000B458C6A|nr:carbohydrate sulfotransferase 11-like [Mizuhopecten yessoensis]